VVWVVVLAVVGAVAVVIAGFADDDDVGWITLLRAIVWLPAVLLFPLCAWGFGALLDVHAFRLDVASLEANLKRLRLTP
jgi:hypothetical protein